jgi:hypothetical protein
VRRADVLAYFSRDDDASVKSVLSDLVDSGLVLQGGRGDRIVYRAADPETLGAEDVEVQAIASLVWITIARHQRITRSDLLSLLPLDALALDVAVASLCADGRVHVDGSTDDTVYASGNCVIPLGDPVGWEASLFDHYQALVTAICTKLEKGRMQATPDDWVGGSTFGFDVWPGHPHHDEVVGLLRELRARIGALRQRVDAHNAAADGVDEAFRVIAYVGQTLVGGPEPGER